MRFRFGGFELDGREGRLWRGAEEVELQPKVADALRLFVEHAGVLLTREELLAALWPGVHVSDDALQQVVRKLRRALGDDPRTPTFVVTALKRGYRFAAEVEVVADPPPPPLPPPPPPPPPPPRSRHRRLAVAVAATAAVAAAVLALGGARARRPHLGPCTSRRLTHTHEREQEGTFVDQAIVFVGNDPAEGQYDLFVTSRRGEGRLRLTHTPGEEFKPQASPDGASILYSRADPGGVALWEIAPTGGTARLVVDAAIYGAWSPDGARIAYVALAADGTRHLAVRRHDGGDDEHALGDVSPDVTSVGWSPRGDLLSYVDGHTAWVVPVDGGAPRAVTPRAEYLRSCGWAGADALVCDGNLLGRSNLWWIPLGGAPVPLTSGAGGLYHPVVSAAGDVLYTAENKQQQVLVVDESGAAHPVATTTAIECIDADPTGAAIAFTDYDPTLGGTEVVFQDLVAGSRDVVGPGRCPRFAHAGGRVAYLRGDGDRERLWLQDLRPGASRALGGPDLTPIAAPAWSPDDSWIAVATTAGMQRVEVASGRSTILARGSFGNAEISPDGTAVAAARDGVVERIDAGGAGTTSTHIPASYRARPTWTATGITTLQDERHAPVLVTYTPAGIEMSRRLVPRNADASTWGTFEAVPQSTGWVVGQTRYESDLYLLSSCLK